MQPGHFLLWLVIDPTRRGEGVGSHLLSEGEALVRAEGGTRIGCDVPGYDLISDPDYDDWHKWTFEGSRAIPEGVIVAADGERLVGLTAMSYRREAGTLYTEGTYVDRAYRGRGIALALKLLAIQTARRREVATMRTNNDSQNAPMLAVNRKLGYVPAPGFYEVVKHL